MVDRNFDDLASQFAQRIYAGTKGQIRLALLERDLEEVLGVRLDGQVAGAMTVLDAGGGEGQFARWLARQGHKITLCDLSAVMLDNARAQTQAEGLEDAFQFVHSAIQDLPVSQTGYDLVLCHAVLEWVADWQGVVHSLLAQLAPGGTLSLMFYNRHSTVFRSLLRGFFERVASDQVAGKGQGLTPMYPLEPAAVVEFLREQGLELQCQSGVRVFHDYMHQEIRERRAAADIIALEKRFSREEPYRALARYYHVMARKPV